MSYANGWALQEAVYTAISAAPGIAGQADVFDATPVAEALPERDYIVLGEEYAVAKSLPGEGLTRHDLTIDIHSATHGFATAKPLAAAVVEALTGEDLSLNGARIIDLSFREARARRANSPTRRRITLKFRALVEQI